MLGGAYEEPNIGALLVLLIGTGRSNIIREQARVVRNGGRKRQMGVKRNSTK